jgi:hypothetical protein
MGSILHFHFFGCIHKRKSCPFPLPQIVTTFQLHLAILTLQVACYTNSWSILFIVITFTICCSLMSLVGANFTLICFLPINKTTYYAHNYT